MMLVRPRIASAVFCIVAALSLNGCAHHSGSPFTPAVTSSIARGDATVIYHQTRTVVDRAEREPIGRTSVAYAGAVTTLPAIVSFATDVAYDPDDGNYYVVEMNTTTSNVQIVRVSSNGATQAFASFPGSPGNIAYDHANRTFYVTAPRTSSYVPGVYALTSTGTATLLAGGTVWGQTDGTGSAAGFMYPSGITVDGANGALYLVDVDRIRRVTTAGVVTTLTPAHSICNIGCSPNPVDGITWNKYDGNFYVGDSWDDLIRKVTPAGVVTTLAGLCGSGGYGGQCAELQRDGVGTNAAFAVPMGISASATTGTLYVADRYNNAIRRVLLNGTVTTLAGNGLQGDVDGAGQNAEFNQPVALTFGSNGLFVLERNSVNNASAIRSVTTTGATPPPLQTNITFYDTKTPAELPYVIDWHATAPSSTTLWYTEAGGKIASLTTSGVSTEYTVGDTGAQFGDIVLGSDGSQWLYDSNEGKVIHRTTTGTVGSSTLPASTYSLPSPDASAFASDGSIWIAQSNGSNGLSHVSTQGVVTSMNDPLNPRDIAIASDGSVWVSDGYNTIERLDKNGNIIRTYNYSAQFLTRGSDGNIWFSQPDAIGKINIINNAIEVFPLYEPVPGCPYYGCSRGITAVTPGPDGAYWFIESATGYIDRIDTSGAVTEYQIYAAHIHPNDIVPGPDGNVWFVDTGAQKIGRVKLH